MARVTEHWSEVRGVEVFWRRAQPDSGSTPVLYVHGVPTHSDDWLPFLEQTGGVAPDLPGFGRSGKPAGFGYSIAGYDRFLGELLDSAGVDRFSLVVHDWGAVGLATAQRLPERIDRLVVLPSVPLLPGYEWHVLARQWRRQVIGELAMGFTTKFITRRLVARGGQTFPASELDEVWSHFDHGTQRAILKLYRSAPPEVLERAGENLAQIEAPALIVWGENDPYIDTSFGHAYADALGGKTTVRTVAGAGHWPWHDEPSLIGEVASFLAP